MEAAFQRLVDIMAKLRGPGGCPWDRQQTHASLKPYLLEEAYEVLESIDDHDEMALKEELGDLMLQSVFHAQIAAEHGRFTISDVLDAINEKLIRRHPHVFGDIEIHTAEEQKILWEGIKRKEGKKSALDGVPAHAPSLLRAYRVQQKAASAGFDWEKPDQVWEKVNEEMDELQEAIGDRDHDAITEEFGDLLFTLVNLSRFIRVHPEDALRMAVDKFMVRFRRVESHFKQNHKDLKSATLQEMDAVWNAIKHDD